jgi:DNA polymerase-3 subunit alpha
MTTASQPVNSTELLWTWLRNGWTFRAPHDGFLGQHAADVTTRIHYEMDTIVGKDFCDYFLIVSDLVRHAKDHGIAVGPGRGSAAASLVCYLLRITEINPMRYPNMLFERFLDPTRDDMPDIDIDFADDRRHEMVEYAKRKYGEDCVGNIANYARFRGKTAIKDIGRVYRIPKWAVETVAGLIIDREAGDPRQNDSVHDVFELFPKAREIAQKWPQIREAENFEGDYRGMSVHAAGIVISSRPITDVCATYTREIGKTKATKHQVSVVAADKKSAEYLGMTKIDFLGLTTMGMIGQSLKIIDMPLEELYRVPLNDQKVLDAFRDGDLTGIFQFEGRTQRGVCRAVEPEDFRHLVDISALARPGPLGSGEYTAYVARRHGRLAIPSVHPVIDEITRHSYGTVIFQEQVFRILAQIGGFSGTEIGRIRRIISGKLGEAAFNELYDAFERGAASNHGISGEDARRIWARMTTASKYLFNYAHACSYSMVAYWSMWLKTNHPLAFYAGQLPKTGKEKTPRLMQDILHHGITILAPDAQVSDLSWEPAPALLAEGEAGALRAGLLQIPNVGETTALAMLAHREAVERSLTEQRRYGAFDWGDYKPVKGIGPKTIATMIGFATAEDPFELHRVSHLLHEYREGIRRGLPDFAGLPIPTHSSNDMPPKGEHPVVWIGFIRKIRFDNELEKQRKYGDNPDATDAEILEQLRDPELLTSAVLFGYDEGDEDVYVRINRWAFPAMRELIEAINLDVDVVVVSATKKDVGSGFGVSIYANSLGVLEPDEAPEEADDDDDDLVGSNA